MEPPPSHTLDVDITLIKPLQALKKLQRNKAISLNGIKVEFILDAGELLHVPLLIEFNCFLAKGFLEALSTKVVHTFFKGGNASKFDNYKGITIGPILAKLFAMILNKRLSEWAEQHGLCAKGQAGFRKDYHTTDQLFILRTLIEQNKTKKNHSIVILWTSKKHSILCHVKCCGMCWLASGWRDVSCNACR